MKPKTITIDGEVLHTPDCLCEACRNRMIENNLYWLEFHSKKLATATRDKDIQRHRDWVLHHELRLMELGYQM